MAHGIVKGGVYWKKEKESSKLRLANGSWSINLGEVNLSQVSTVIYCTSKAHYIISSDTALANGFVRTLGGELKLVVPLKHWMVDEKVVASRKT